MLHMFLSGLVSIGYILMITNLAMAKTLTDEEITKRVDEYIISKVGKEYFTTHYLLQLRK